MIRGIQFILLDDRVSLTIGFFFLFFFFCEFAPVDVIEVTVSLIRRDGVDIPLVRRGSNSRGFGLALMAHVAHFSTLVAPDVVSSLLRGVPVLGLVSVLVAVVVLLSLGSPRPGSGLPVIFKTRLFIRVITILIVKLGLESSKILGQGIHFSFKAVFAS